MKKRTLYVCIFLALASMKGAVAEENPNNLNLLNKLREEKLVTPAIPSLFSSPSEIEQDSSEEISADNSQKKDNPQSSLLTAQWYKQQLSELNNKNKKLQSEIGNIRKKLAAVTNEPVPETLEVQAKETARQLADTQQALHKANEENARMLASAKQAAQDKAKLDAQIATLNAQQAQSSLQSSKQLAEAQAAGKKASDENTRLLEAVKQATQGKVKQDAQIATLTEQQAQVAKQLLEAQAAEKKTSNDNLRLQRVEKQAAQEKTKVDAQIASLKTEKEQLSAQVAKQQADTLASSKKWADEQAALTTQLANLNKQLAERPAADENSTIPSREQVKTAITADNKAGRLAKRAYSLGYFIGLESEKELKKITAFTADVDQNIVLKGVLDRFQHTPLLTDKEIEASLAVIDKEISENTVAKANKNKAINEQIMAKAVKMKNAVKAKSDFIYIIHKPGSALKVKLTDNIRIQIIEKLGDGTVIASERDSNVVAANVKDIPLTLQEVVMKLGVGGEATLYIPPNLAYGEKGIPGKIAPNSLSIMKVRVLGIKDI